MEVETLLALDTSASGIAVKNSTISLPDSKLVSFAARIFVNVKVLDTSIGL